jgi:hypothetical protein
MGRLIHIIYASAESTITMKDELLDLLEKSRKNNLNEGITGMLLHIEGSFFQILEGEEKSVEKLFELICRDQRHHKITVIIKESIAERAFSEWSMAFAGATKKQLENIEGLNDFFEHGSYLADIDPGRAKKILKAFSKGHWRAKLSNQ